MQVQGMFTRGYYAKQLQLSRIKFRSKHCTFSGAKAVRSTTGARNHPTRKDATNENAVAPQSPERAATIWRPAVPADSPHGTVPYLMYLGRRRTRRLCTAMHRGPGCSWTKVHHGKVGTVPRYARYEYTSQNHVPCRQSACRFGQ